MATPAEGPSLGTAPAGTWMWMSVSEQFPAVDAELRGRLVIQAEGRCADSRITSPICPVNTMFPLPGYDVASTKMISPPKGV